MRAHQGPHKYHRRTNLVNWLYGYLPDDPQSFQRDAYKVTMSAQILPQKPVIVLIFGAVVSYILLIICGTLGSPNPLKINSVNCGLHNNCTLAFRDDYDAQSFFLWRQGQAGLLTLKEQQEELLLKQSNKSRRFLEMRNHTKSKIKFMQ